MTEAPLQLCETSPGAEIRTRGQDTGHPGGSDEAAVHVQGDLLVEDRFAGMGEGQVDVRPRRDLGPCRR